MRLAILVDLAPCDGRETPGAPGTPETSGNERERVRGLGSRRTSAGGASRGACLACEAVVSKGTSSYTPNFCQCSMVVPVPLQAQERGITVSLPYR